MDQSNKFVWWKVYYKSCGFIEPTKVGCFLPELCFCIHILEILELSQFIGSFLARWVNKR